jgi:hypothetical protein
MEMLLPPLLAAHIQSSQDLEWLVQMDINILIIILPVSCSVKLHYKQIMFWGTSIFLLLIHTQPLVGQGLIIVEVSWLHLDTPHSVGIPSMSDQPTVETPLPDNTQHSQETDIHAPSRIQTSHPSKQVAVDPHLIDCTTTGISYRYLYLNHIISNIIVTGYLLLESSCSADFMGVWHFK